MPARQIYITPLAFMYYPIDLERYYGCQYELTIDVASSLQRQVSVMSMNLSAKLDDLQRGDRQLETTVALCEIRTQLQELTKSVESCQSEVSEVGTEIMNPNFYITYVHTLSWNVVITARFKN